MLSNNTVAENALPGTVIGNLIVSDPDSDQTHSCKLVDDAQNTFELNNNILTVKTTTLLNFERASTTSILASCRDSGFPAETLTKQLTIVIDDVNEKPIALTMSRTTVAENAADELVGILTTSDPDISDTLFTYTLVKGSDQFVLKNEQQLFTKDELNFEKKNSYDIRLRSTDRGGTFCVFIKIA